MNQTPFTYQRWYVRIFCSMVMCPLVLTVQLLCAKLLGIENVNFLYCIICVLTALAGAAVYYSCTQRCKWFEEKGAWWVENGVVYIQKKNRIYELKRVRWLRGTTVSVYGYAKSGMLVVHFEKGKLLLVSSSVKPVENFAECEWMPLFEAIRACNAELEKDDTLDFWYEIKKP